ncbi:sigma factor-like helix-turn-helix DNA-binding protein [[Kitasatospora] papulosa]|uniref:sigma factor-like helix-turn-helix DNA-binding protein n=1 Tax=[Kitasatospora] papulosa TaxID=1464011 RepID=UPI0036C026D2
MAEVVPEEARKVVDALNRVEEIEDPVARAVAVSQVLKDFKERAPQLREMQRVAIDLLRAQDVSYRQIAAQLGMSLGAVQNIERGHGSAWGTKPRKKPVTE